MQLPSTPRTSDSPRPLTWPQHPSGIPVGLGSAALTAGSCWSCAGCSARAACARTAWLELQARHDLGVQNQTQNARFPNGHLKVRSETPRPPAGRLYGQPRGRDRGQTLPSGRATGRRLPCGHRTWLTAPARPSRKLARLPGARLERAARLPAGAEAQLLSLPLGVGLR